MNNLVLPIETVSTNGEGIARHEGKVVFVPFTLPGETWLAEVVEDKKSFSRALPIHIVSMPDEPAIQRIEPKCGYYGKCGGCHLQHIADADQAALKQAWLKETFMRIAHIEVDPAPTKTASAWDYRNKATIPIVNRDAQIEMGYRRACKPDEIIPIASCPIAHPKIQRALPDLSELLQRDRPDVQPYQDSEHPGSRVQLRVIDGALHAVFYDLAFPTEYAAARFAQSSIHENGVFDTISMPWGKGFRREYNQEGFNTIESDDAPSAFLQVNEAVGAMLYEHIAGLPFERNHSCLDGYCGAGELTIKLSHVFTRVDGVERNEEALRWAFEETQKQERGSAVDYYHASVEEFLREAKTEYDAMVLNPPRAGLSKEARKRARQAAPKDLAIVSCHPAAMARDAQSFLEAGYEIQSLQPFDMFPQTYHLEAVIHLRKA